MSDRWGFKLLRADGDDRWAVTMPGEEFWHSINITGEGWYGYSAPHDEAVRQVEEFIAEAADVLERLKARQPDVIPHQPSPSDVCTCGHERRRHVTYRKWSPLLWDEWGGKRVPGAAARTIMAASVEPTGCYDHWTHGRDLGQPILGAGDVLLPRVASPAFDCDCTEFTEQEKEA